VVGALQQKVFYPRVVFPKATVYFRSKELSLAELSAAVDSLRKSLVDVQGQLNTLRDGSIKAFQDVYAQLADLRKALGALKIPAGLDLTMIQSQIDALKSKLDGLIASLPDFSKFALITQLPDLTQYAKLTDLTNAIAGLASKAYVDNAIAGLQQQLNALPTTQAVTDAIAAALNPYATKTYVDNAVAALTTRVNALCTSLKTATVAIDPDGAGPLPTVQAPVSLPGVATPCP